MRDPKKLLPARRRRAPAAAAARAVAWAALAAVAAAPAPARAQALHCGRSVVILGDSPADVLRKCGSPKSRQGLGKGGENAAIAVAPPGKRKPAARAASGGGRGGGREAWTYDLGPRQLVRILTFERGRLVAIDHAGYGTR